MKSHLIAKLLEALRPGRGSGSLVERAFGPIQSAAPSRPSSHREAPESKSWEQADPDRQHEDSDGGVTHWDGSSPRYSRIHSVGGLSLVVPTNAGERSTPKAPASRGKDASKIVAVDLALAGWVNPRSTRRRGR